MIQALTVIHMIVSILLVIIVLLQFGRGAEAGFFSDTSSQGVFAGPGPANVLTRLTAFLAVLFLGLALYLAHLRGRYRGSSVFDSELPSTSLETPAPPAPEASPSAPTVPQPGSGAQKAAPENRPSPSRSGKSCPLAG